MANTPKDEIRDRLFSKKDEILEQVIERVKELAMFNLRDDITTVVYEEVQKHGDETDEFDDVAEELEQKLEQEVLAKIHEWIDS